jgi:YHS domain-containing protein
MASAASAVDPVCGMRVDVATARHTADVDGITYYFCCANCRARFLHDPQASRAHT